MRFFATSWYGHVGISNERFESAVAQIRERLAQYDEFAGLPIEVHEFAVLTDEKHRRLWGGDASEWGASWMADMTERIYRNDVSEVFQWHTSTYGIPHPRTHVLALLERMTGGRRLSVEGIRRSDEGSVGCVAARSGTVVDVLVYRHTTAREDGSAEPITVRVNAPGENGVRWSVDEAYIIDAEHSGYIRAFYQDAEAAGLKPYEDGLVHGKGMVKGLGAPMFGVLVEKRFGPEGRVLFDANRAKYKALAALSPLRPLPDAVVDADGVSICVSMRSHSVIYIRLRSGE